MWSCYVHVSSKSVRGKAWRSEGGSNAMYYGRYFSNQVVVGWLGRNDDNPFARLYPNN